VGGPGPGAAAENACGPGAEGHPAGAVRADGEGLLAAGSTWRLDP